MKDFFNVERRTIHVEAVDTKDRAFVISTPSALDSLKTSIATYGILNIPYLARAEKSGRYRIVCGYRRMCALAALGITRFDANLFDTPHNSPELLLFSLMDNLSHRAFNIIEMGAAAERLLAHFSRKEVICRYLPLIGARPTETCLAELIAIASLEPGLKEGVLRGILTEKAAIALSAFSDADRDMVFSLFSQLNLSASKQVEVIENLKDISLRDGTGIDTVLHCSQIQELVSSETLNRSQKTEQIRQAIRKIRSPGLSDREKRFSDIRSALDLPQEIQLVPPPFFEGDTYRLQISFNSRDDLAAALEKSVQMMDDINFNRLFQG